MKLKLPLTYDDVTVEMMQKSHNAKGDIGYIQAFLIGQDTDLTKLPKVAVQKAYAHLKGIMAKPTQRFVQKFEHRGEVYGFVPDWRQFTTGEYIDMEEFSGDPVANAHRLLALLYRKVTASVGDSYEVAPYTAYEDSKPFLEMPADLFQGAMLFFWTTKVNLLGSTQSSLMEMVTTNSVKSGDGTPSSTPLQGSRISQWKQYLKNRLQAFSVT